MYYQITNRWFIAIGYPRKRKYHIISKSTQKEQLICCNFQFREDSFFLPKNTSLFKKHCTFVKICNLKIVNLQKKTPLQIFDKIANTPLYHFCYYHCFPDQFYFLNLEVLCYLIKEIPFSLIINATMEL